MKHTKDLNWLSAPAFLLILFMVYFSAGKQKIRNPESRIKSEKSTGYSSRKP